MRELRTSGSVGRAPGNRCLYPEGDGLQLTLRFSFQPRLMPSVDMPSDVKDGEPLWYVCLMLFLLGLSAEAEPVKDDG
jgi:hypothetical protein